MKAEGLKGNTGLSMIGSTPVMPLAILGDSQFLIILFIYLISVTLSSIFNRLGYLFNNPDHRAFFLPREEIGAADLRP